MIFSKLVMGNIVKSMQKKCKHDYLPWANVHGDLTDDMKCRTVLVCKNCGKKVFKNEYIPAPLNYNAILEFYYLKGKLKDSTAAYEAVEGTLVRNKKQFLELFGDKY